MLTDMAKRALYSRDDILGAAVRAAAQRGHAATVADVTSLLGAPSGSIYHRFPTREALFVSAWVRCVHQFHDAFASVSGIEDPIEAIIETGLLIPRFCREHPEEALTLTLYRYADLLDSIPSGLDAQIVGLNDPVSAHIAELTRRRFGSVTPRRQELIALACRDTPYGAIRSRIGGPIPSWLDQPIAEAIRAIASFEVAAEE